MNRLLWATLLTTTVASAATLLTPEELGQLFFFDPSLSQAQDIGCFTCHQPANAFADTRQNAGKGMVSLGSGGMHYGIRNAPPVTYAANSPRFHYEADSGLYRGGQFWDGRASDLEEQITGPLFTSFEMNMPDALAVTARLEKNAQYAYNLKALYGNAVFNTVGKPGLGYQTARAFSELQNTIAAYERSPALRSYDSKYDRYLQGQATLTPQEERGRQIFFDPARSNCASCHLGKAPGSTEEPFSNYYYYNIGVPRNPELIRLAGRAADYIDHGLMANPRTMATPAWMANSARRPCATSLSPRPTCTTASSPTCAAYCTSLTTTTKRAPTPPPAKTGTRRKSRKPLIASACKRRHLQIPTLTRWKPSCAHSLTPATNHYCRLRA